MLLAHLSMPRQSTVLLTNIPRAARQSHCLVTRTYNSKEGAHLLHIVGSVVGVGTLHALSYIQNFTCLHWLNTYRLCLVQACVLQSLFVIMHQGYQEVPNVS